LARGIDRLPALSCADSSSRHNVICLLHRRCADFVLLNKVDLLPAGKLQQLTDIITSLNPLATVRIPPPSADSFPNPAALQKYRNFAD
jgi:hypothetical protein